MAQFATVAAITGNGTVYAVNAQGISRALKAGDALQKGETVRTVGDARVELVMEDGRLLAVAPEQTVRLDANVVESDQRPTAQDSAVAVPGATAETVIQALERGTDLSQQLEATAAGLNGGAGGADGGSTFVQLLRITEGVDPLSYNYSFTAPDLPPDLQTVPVIDTPPVVSVDVTVGTQVGVGGSSTGLIAGDLIKGAVSAVDVVEGSSGADKTVTFLITLDKVSTTDVTVTYTIVPGTANNPADFHDGATTATVTIPAGYIGFSVTEFISGDTLVEGNETFNIVLSNPVGATLLNDTATVTIIDDDAATVHLSASPAEITEAGADVTYTATLTGAIFSTDVTVTLSNGQTITIPAGETSGSVKVVFESSDDVYVDPSSANVVISGADAGAFTDKLTIDGAPATVTIKDTIDATTVTLTAAESVTEGGTIVYTATVSNAVTGSDLVITLDNGKTITIPVGATSADSAAVAVRADEAYVQGTTTVTAAITGTAGGNFEALDTTSTASTSVVDDHDATTVTLTATSTITEAGTSITYTATLSDPAAVGSPVTVTLSNNETITIAGGASSGFVVHAVTANEDVYLDPTTVSATISAATGGNFESLVVNSAPAVTAITDTIQDTTVTLTATSTITEAGTSITYTATLSNPAAVGSPVTVTLSNNETITIAGGASSGFVVHAVTANEDVYLDPTTVSATISAATGGNFENLVVNPAAAVTAITDTIQDTTATLSTSATSISETGGSITYTIALTGSPGSVAPKSDMEFTLANGEKITVLANQTTGSVTKVYSDTDITTQANIANSISAVTAGGTEYEHLVTTGSTLVDVNYAVTIADLTPAAEGGDVIVDEDDLLASRGTGEVAGSDATKESTTVQGSFKISAPDGVNDVTVDGHAVITNGAFAAISFTTALGNTFAVTTYNALTGEITYTYTLNDNETHTLGSGQNSLFEDLVVTLTDLDASSTNGTLSVQIVDDVPSVTANAVVDGGITLTTHDSVTIDPQTDVASANFTAALLTAAVPNYGADGAGGTVLSAYTLTVTSATSGLSSHGVAITLAKDGTTGDIVGSAGAVEVFRISVNADGTVTLLTQSAQIDHVGVGNDLQIALVDGKISLNATATTTDGDGDTATATVSLDLGGNIIFVDDVPTINSIQHGVVDNEGGLSINGQILATPGADGIATYQFDPATTTPPSGLTYTLSNSNTQLVATDGTGETVFIVNVNQNGTYDFVLVKPAPESVAVTPPFSTLDIPNHADAYTVNLYGSYTTAGVGIGPVLGTVTFSDTQPDDEYLSVSQDGLGIDNNLMNVGEKLMMTFDTPVSNATFNIGNFSDGDKLVWKVYGSDGVTVLDSGTIDHSFYDASGVQVNLVSAENLDYSINLATNGLDSGLLFTSMSLESTNNSFKFTGFSVEKAVTVADQNYNFGVVAVDNDGDTTTGSFSVLVDGTGNDLVGTAGSDVINAGTGNDTITGGLGDDVLTGGLGSDTFKWNLNDTGADVIKDFALAPAASGGDVLDLKDLLTGEQATAASLDAYLDFSANASGQTVMSVHATGAGAVTQTITLENVQLTDLHTYAGSSDVAIITTLMANGNLKTDV